MSQPSLGLIETIGLAAAIEAADAAVKSANVTLVGYELSRGDGMTVVKVEGEVGAVNAAIAAAAVAAAKVGRVVSTRVIARPASGIVGMIANGDTVGARSEPVGAPSAVLKNTAVAEPLPAAAPASIAAPAAVEESSKTAVPAGPIAAPTAPDVPPQRVSDAERNPGKSEYLVPLQSSQAKAGGRSSNGKSRNRHGA
jgi:microcompartment protein CcmL/EutN